MAGWTLGTEAWIWMGAWALVMALVVWLLVREPRHAPREDPSTILRERFARGEISEDEFKRASSTLDAELPVAGTGSNRHHIARHAHPGQEARHD
jgi:uncharacterized membrane protein